MNTLNTLKETPIKDIRKPKNIRDLNLMNMVLEYASKNNNTFSEKDIYEIRHKLGHISHWTIVKTIIRSNYYIHNI